MRNIGNWIKWAVAILAGVFLAFVAARSVAADPGSTGYILGTIIGGPFLIALGIRWVYMRINQAAEGLWSVWLVPIMVAVFAISHIGEGAR